VRLSHKHFFSLEHKTLDIARGIEDIKSANWWDLESWIVVPDWVRIISHLLIVCQMIIVVCLLFTNCKFRRRRKTAKLQQLMNRGARRSQNEVPLL